MHPYSATYQLPRLLYLTLHFLPCEILVPKNINSTISGWHISCILFSFFSIHIIDRVYKYIRADTDKKGEITSSPKIQHPTLRRLKCVTGEQGHYIQRAPRSQIILFWSRKSHPLWISVPMWTIMERGVGTSNQECVPKPYPAHADKRLPEDGN